MKMDITPTSRAAFNCGYKVGFIATIHGSSLKWLLNINSSSHNFFINIDHLVYRNSIIGGISSTFDRRYGVEF
jgi:ribosomal protein L31